MAVDYSQGYSGAIADQYKDLRQALASEGEARNRQKAREIEDKGLFGSGIRQSDIADFGDIAIRGAEFGEKRMGRKMDRATASFERRKLADERRIASLKERAKGKGGKVYADLMGEIQGLEIGMGERRNSFEDFMGKYQEKGLWGTGFGGEDVGYRTEGESKYSQEMARKKLGSGPEGGSGDETDWSNLGDLGEGREGRFAPEGDRLDRYSSYPHQPREFEKMDYETGGDGGMPEQPLSESQQVGRHPLADNQEPMTWENNPLNPASGRGKGEQGGPGASETQDSGTKGSGDVPGIMNLGDSDSGYVDGKGKFWESYEAFMKANPHMSGVNPAKYLTPVKKNPIR